jgi:hypothetical protein
MTNKFQFCKIKIPNYFDDFLIIRELIFGFYLSFGFWLL